MQRMRYALQPRDEAGFDTGRQHRPRRVGICHRQQIEYAEREQESNRQPDAEVR